MKTSLCLIVFVGSLCHEANTFSEDEFEMMKQKLERLTRSHDELALDIKDTKLNLAVKRNADRFIVDQEMNVEQELLTLKNDIKQMKSGYTGGNWYQDTGGASNYVCLPEQPTWPAKYQDGIQSYGARMYGTEYEDNQEGTYNPFNVHRDDDDAPCVVCRSQRATTIMIPARSNCYSGWHQEYSGYLMANARGYPSSTEYICVDKEPEAVLHGSASLDGSLLYVVEAVCGSLPCLPYVEGRELACAVCSK